FGESKRLIRTITRVGSGGVPRSGDSIPRSESPFWGTGRPPIAPIQVPMRAAAATLAVLGLLAATCAGGASGAGNPNIAALQVGLRTHGLYARTGGRVPGP